MRVPRCQHFFIAHAIIFGMVATDELLCLKNAGAQISKFFTSNENRPNGLNWQCCLADSSETAPRILILLMAMGADYSFELIFIETYAPQFIGLNKLFLGSVCSETVLLCGKQRFLEKMSLCIFHF